VGDYVRAKARLLEAQDADGYAVLNADDEASAPLFDSVRGRLLRFSTRSVLDEGAFLREGTLTLRIDDREEALLSGEELPVPGEHNQANALAAALACRLLGASTDGITRGLRGYRALPHRLERVASVAGVDFYNDSKATNLDAVVRALRSFPRSSVHLILGGRDKGADWPSLASDIQRYACRVILVGEAADAIRDGLSITLPVESCGSVPEAVRAAFLDARSGEVVLLSPGCASFDQYRNFEERGEDFRRAVRSLTAEGGGRA
jgi:UDP-N-acetylmuramoylalanine--D-glutamate ligase